MLAEQFPSSKEISYQQEHLLQHDFKAQCHGLCFIRCHHNFLIVKGYPGSEINFVTGLPDSLSKQERSKASGLAAASIKLPLSQERYRFGVRFLNLLGVTCRFLFGVLTRVSSSFLRFEERGLGSNREEMWKERLLALRFERGLGSSWEETSKERLSAIVTSWRRYTC